MGEEREPRWVDDELRGAFQRESGLRELLAAAEQRLVALGAEIDNLLQHPEVGHLARLTDLESERTAMARLRGRLEASVANGSASVLMGARQRATADLQRLLNTPASAAERQWSAIASSPPGRRAEEVAGAVAFMAWDGRRAAWTTRAYALMVDERPASLAWLKDASRLAEEGESLLADPDRGPGEERTLGGKPVTGHTRHVAAGLAAS